MFGVTDTTSGGPSVFSANLTVIAHSQPEFATDPDAVVCTSALHTLLAMFPTPIMCPPVGAGKTVSYITLRRFALNASLAVQEIRIFRTAGAQLSCM